LLPAASLSLLLLLPMPTYHRFASIALSLLVYAAVNCDAGIPQEVAGKRPFNSEASSVYYSSQTKNEAFDCKLCLRGDEDSVVNHPIPFKYIKNEGQLRRTLFAYMMGPDFCRYAINQDIVHSFKSDASYAILLSNDTVTKNLYKEYMKEIKDEVAQAPFYYYPLYLFDFYSTMLAFAYISLKLAWGFIRTFRDDRIAKKESQIPIEGREASSTTANSSLRTYGNLNDNKLTMTVRDGKVAYIRKKNE